MGLMSYEKEKKALFAMHEYAAKKILAGRDSFVPGTKAEGTDVVTSVDKDIDAYCLSLLSKEFPDDLLITEEEKPENEKHLGQGRAWTVDPLDGTWNYASGIPMYGFQAAFFEGGKAKLSLIGIPTEGAIVFAEAGKGCFINGKPAPARIKKDDRLTLFAYGEGAYQGKVKEMEKADKITAMKPRIGRFRLYGACSYVGYLVAKGSLDGYIAFHQHLWDVAPGLLIMQECGLTILGADGKAYRFPEEDYAALYGDSIIAAYREEVAQSSSR